MKIKVEIELDEQIAEDFKMGNAEDLGAAIRHGISFMHAMEFRRSRNVRGRMTPAEKGEYEYLASCLIKRIEVAVDNDSYTNINLQGRMLP